MSLFGPVTDSDRRRWQMRAVRVLSEILTGPGAELPPLRWSINAHAGLTGHVEIPLVDDELDRAAARQHFDAWAQALGAQVRPPTRDLLGLRLYAFREEYPGRVDVAVIADLGQDAPDDAAVTA